MQNLSGVILYLWDYFYVANAPEPGDEKAWGVIERATCRIRESEIYLGASTPPDVRVRHARRIRNAVRVALRNIERLSVAPERWVLDQLAELESHCDDLLSAPPEQVVLH
jgi:hypothetical protein